MTRLVLAVVIGASLVAGFDRAADTAWAVPLALIAVVFAVAVVFVDDRERHNLELYERRERLRQERSQERSRRTAS